jgi:hypothetical protein
MRRLALVLFLAVGCDQVEAPPASQLTADAGPAPCLPAPEQANPGNWVSVGSVCYTPDGSTVRCIVSCEQGAPGATPSEMCYVRFCP